MHLLHLRTWREIRATARAHHLRFNTNLSKEAAFQWLIARLCEDRLLKKRYQELSQEAIAASKPLSPASRGREQ